MKLALISDIHANLEALQATLDDVARQGVDCIVCLGDIVGYNANPSECIALLQKAGAVCVAGNHDRAVCRQMTAETFSKTAAHAVEWTRQHISVDDFAFLADLPAKADIGGQLIAIHGALHPDTGCENVRLDDDERRTLSFNALIAHPSGARICAFGHTHRTAVYERCNGQMNLRADNTIRLHQDAHYLINPGSVGAPTLNDSRAGYMLLDLAQKTIMVRRIDYDVAAALAKTRRAGLAPYRAYLPRAVRRMIRRGLNTVGPLPTREPGANPGIFSGSRPR